MKLTGGVQLKSSDLDAAQKALGNEQNTQAIIPMNGSTAGDPHTLPKSWDGGAVKWGNWDDINPMREQCSKEVPLLPGTFIGLY